MNSEQVRQLIKECRLQNECAGIAEFRQFAKLSPNEACDIGWWKIAELPYQDDGGSVWPVLQVMADTDSNWVQERLMDAWPKLNDERRSAITATAQCRTILPFDFWIDLFWHRASCVRDRHRLLASLVRFEYREEVRPLANKLLTAIGRYDDDWRNSILDEFVIGARKSYGLLE